VTAADVQRVIKEYVSDRHRVTVEYRAAAATGAKK
jgi:hypothetical protein